MIIVVVYTLVSLFLFQTNAYWWFSNVCTTGHWQMSRYYVGDHDFISKNTVRFDLKWFVRCDIINFLTFSHFDGEQQIVMKKIG